MDSGGLLGVGLSHLSAPLSSRERASVSREALARELSAAGEGSGASELALLSTCSRLEAFAWAEDPGRAEAGLRAWFAARGAPEALLCARRGPEALHHLFRVASGLDSWILGESEVLGQVREAYEAARAAGRTGRVLNRAFQRALACGKEVRSRTGLQDGVRSIGGAAALLARKIFGEGGGGRVVVFGAGQAAEAVVRHLAAKDYRDLAVANRSPERARALAEALGAAPLGLEEGLDSLVSARIAVFSTGAAEPLLKRERLAAILRRRAGPLFLIDLGSPRNVERDCGGLDGAFLYDLDDLKRLVSGRSKGKAAEKAKAEALAAQAAEDCREHMDRRVPA